MNPIIRDRTSLIVYATSVYIYAGAYAVLFGVAGRLPWGAVAADGIIYGLVYALIGAVIWNIIRYALPRNNLASRALSLIAACLVSTICLIGIECCTAWLCLGDGFVAFASSIPLRAMMSLLSFTILIVYYTFKAEEDDQPAPPVPVATRKQADLLERITIKGGGKIKVVMLDDVEYLQADGDYVSIVTREGRWLKEQTMKYFEEHLPPEMFIRVHRSYIVGVSKITRIERYGNLYQVVLRSGDKIKVSATGYKLLKEQLRL